MERKYFGGSLLDLALKQAITGPQGHLGPAWGHPGDMAESKLADFPISPTMERGLGVETRILAAGFSAISHLPASLPRFYTICPGTGTNIHLLLRITADTKTKVKDNQINNKN